MANSKNNVIVGKPLVTGGVLVATVGATAPTDATTALDAAFNALGYLTDSGVVKSEKRNTGVVYAWGGDSIALTKKGYDVTVKLGLAEFLNSKAQTTVYGASHVTATAATSTKGNLLAVEGTSDLSPHSAMIVEIFNDGGKKLRLYFPDIVVMDIGDTSYTDDKVASLELTLQAFPDANGNYFVQFSDDGQITP
ncbi:phage tail tube protein [Arthrobacter sp. HY1533]|uniref:phage tail tube protein n=1 Tax=Arthrobacter sp. HY1533 TaxID=2970919 RepID=UPI0022B9FF7F|nr:hypothetical protein [Arthrobacter sp. HY1533]